MKEKVNKNAVTATDIDPSIRKMDFPTKMTTIVTEMVIKVV